MRVLAFVLLFLTTASSAWGQYPFEESPWRATVTVGGNTYRVWVDEVALNPDAPHGISPWKDMQLYCRHYCFGCALQSWGQSQFDRAMNALEAKDQNYVPLDSMTFVPVNIALVGGYLRSRHPTWRDGERDSFVVVLRDGRRLVGLGPIDVPPPDLSFRMWRSRNAKTCAQLQRVLGPVTIHSRDELLRLAEAQKDRYGDRPWANIALVPVPNLGRPFAPRDARTVYLYFDGARVDLKPAGHPSGELTGEAGTGRR